MVEWDENYFGGRYKGRYGRGATGKMDCLRYPETAKQDVFTLAVENIRRNTSLPVIKKKTMPDNVGYTGCCKSYDVLDVSEFTNQRINHSQLFAGRQNQTSTRQVSS